MTTPFHLDNKVILVTGASSGIGRQIAVSISQMGGKLVLTARNEERLQNTLQALEGDGHQQIAADMLNEDSRTAMVQALPGLDGVVHCAGVVNPLPVRFLKQKHIDETFNINYETTVLLMAQLAKKKKLNKAASVVFMSSISGQHPHKGGAMYAGSKAAIESFSKVFALEFQGTGIRSNCLSPAMVRTPMYDEAVNEMSQELMDEHIAKYPLGVGYPEDVANAAVFLLSDAARWVTGINLRLDGGYILER